VKAPLLYSGSCLLTAVGQRISLFFSPVVLLECTARRLALATEYGGSSNSAPAI
jgi:hypothetical protein